MIIGTLPRSTGYSNQSPQLTRSEALPCSVSSLRFFHSPALHGSSPKSLRDRCCILSIDGGGIRGIIPGKILQEIERKTEKPIAKSFNMIAGTSTGGILGLGLSLPSPENPQQPRYTAEEVVDLYLKKDVRERIFKRPKAPKPKPLKTVVHPHHQTLSPNQRPSVPLAGIHWDDSGISTTLFEKKVAKMKTEGECYEISIGALKIEIPKKSIKNLHGYQFHSDYETIRQWVQPKFIARGIEGVLKERFGETKLSQLIPEEVFVTSFNTSTMRHHLWSKKNANTSERFDIPAWKAARATSAAPTYFPAFHIDDHEHVDGGVCMNNPTLALLAQAQKLGFRREDIFCVSLGTGQFSKPLAPTAHFGPLHWAPSIFDMVSCGISSQTDEYMSTLLGQDQYIRIEINLSENIALDSDDPTSIQKLEAYAEKAIHENKDKLEKIYQAIHGR